MGGKVKVKAELKGWLVGLVGWLVSTTSKKKRKRLCGRNLFGPEKVVSHGRRAGWFVGGLVIFVNK